MRETNGYDTVRPYGAAIYTRHYRTRALLLCAALTALAACSASPTSPSAPLGATGDRSQLAVTGCAVSYQAPANLTANPHGGTFDLAWDTVPNVDDYVLVVRRLDGQTPYVYKPLRIYPTDQKPVGATRTYTEWTSGFEGGTFEFRIAIYAACTKAAGELSAPVVKSF